MDQVTNGPNRGGGDTRTPSAKQAIARREEQIAAFLRALHRNTAVDIQTHHRSELAELDAQQAKLWTVVDNPKVSEKNLIAAINAMNRIHIRRAHLLGLDAPTKLDVSGIYRIGTDELSEERRETERAWRSLPVEEQVRIYDAFDAARKRLNAPIETTATVTIGPDNRNDVEPPTADDET
jgi:hypothetical protein